jgi:hypothetical protein
MSIDRLRNSLKELTLQGLSAITESPFGMAGCKSANAYFDNRKDDLITGLAAYQPAVDALGQLPAVQDLFGSAEARRLAIQFVFNACRYVTDESSFDAAYEHTWAAFSQEVGNTTWSYKAVANMQNIECDHAPLALGQGVSIRGRSFEELSALLNWGTYELDQLINDWVAGANSSFVMLIEAEVAKTPANFLMVNDGSQYQRAFHTLLAMRLLAPGDVRIGRLFAARPAAFNVGLGGMQSSGFTVWHPGTVYRLASEQVPMIKRTCQDLLDLEQQPGKTNRTLLLALRSFSSIYDRLFHQAEDRVVDAITALEALWKLDAELSFKLAFRTSSLLAETDDERVSIYETLSEYYRIRSKVVHGGSLTVGQEQQLREDEPLRSIVRRTLRAFLHLAVNPGEWTLKRLNEEADRTLLHDDGRQSLRAAMGI